MKLCGFVVESWSVEQIKLRFGLNLSYWGCCLWFESR